MRCVLYGPLIDIVVTANCVALRPFAAMVCCLVMVATFHLFPTIIQRFQVLHLILALRDYGAPPEKSVHQHNEVKVGSYRYNLQQKCGCGEKGAEGNENMEIIGMNDCLLNIWGQCQQKNEQHNQPCLHNARDRFVCVFLDQGSMIKLGLAGLLADADFSFTL